MADINDLRRTYARVRNEAIGMGDTKENFDAFVITHVMELAQVYPVGPNDYVHYANLRKLGLRKTNVKE